MAGGDDRPCKKLVVLPPPLPAFVSGRSAGSWFTCSFAASLGLPVVVFPACAESSAGRLPLV
ncbi:MAG: hypothetical protein JRI48_10915 [Deltaproteobacteria bacterium]|nr:hypothetical protein [Deltaproteobacteria bacterium]